MRIKKAEYIKNYEIKLLFNNGVTKIVDFKPLLTTTRKLVIPLLDLEYFKNFHLDEITICWPNDLDFCPETLYDLGKEVKTKGSRGVHGKSRHSSSSPKLPSKSVTPTL